jgi:DNA-binding transcriptional regulator GbsR (MarR family)
MSDPTPLAHAQAEIAEIFGNIAAFWGFTRTQGRIYGLLFLSPEPLGHKEVQAQLGISAGSASMTLSSLAHWGVVRRSGRLYEAETDMWKVITGVFRRRERDQVDAAIAGIGRVSAILDAVAEPDDAVRFAQARVQQLADFFNLGRRFLEAFVSQSPIHGLLATIAQKAASFRPILRPPPHSSDVRR